MLQPSPTTDHPRKSLQLLLPLLSGFLIPTALVGALAFSLTISNRVHAADVASTQCATRQSSETLNDGFGNVEIWLRMTTTWCWNGITVTSHTTTLAWGTTTLGHAAGYTGLGSPASAFNCYVAAGAPTGGGCSGNHEVATEPFLNGLLMDEVDLTINQEENYKGQFFSQGSQRHCPGGC